jgi:hypothetical protein
MVKLRARVLCSSVLLFSVACFPSTRMGEAHVKLADDHLCIGVTDKEVDRLGDLKLFAITVYDRSSAPPSEVWSAQAKDQSANVVLTSGRCLRYGEPPPAFTGTPMPAPRLDPDRLYSVSINASPVKGKRDGTQGYDVMFCLRSSGRQLAILPPNATSCSGP